MHIHFSKQVRIPQSIEFLCSMLEKKDIAQFFPDSKDTIKKYPNILVVYVSQKEIHQLNNTYRKKDKATDVLSFELYDNEILGELYICLKEVYANAQEFHVTKEYETIQMIIHGILHLLGNEHSDTMFTKQDKVTTQLYNEYKTYYRTRESR